MNARPSDERIWETLVHFSRAPLGTDDAARLEQWVASDAARRDMVHAVQRLGAVARQRPLSRRADAAWERVSARIAAGARATPQDAAAPPRARLRAPRIPVHAQRRWTIVAAFAVAASLLVLVARVEVERRAAVASAARADMRELATRVGERMDLLLDDGSTVTLGPTSRLRYGRFAGAPTRTVELEGEAYFRVAPDREHPFRVLAGHATVQAIGTAFDVRAYAGDSVVQVVTTEGRVALRPQQLEGPVGTFVDRGQRGTLDTRGAATVGDVDVRHYVGWLDGRLAYELVPLDAVLRDLERRYDLRFAIADTSIASVRLTITFDRASEDDVVAQLAETLDIPYTRQGRLVRLGAR